MGKQVYFWVIPLIGFLILLLLRIQIIISYTRNGLDDKLNIQLSFFPRLFKIKIHVPIIKIKNSLFKSKIGVSLGNTNDTDRNKSEVFTVKKSLAYIFKTLPDNVRKLLWQYRHFKPAFFYLAKSIRILNLKWVTSVGTGDPASTGVISGVLWSVKGMFIALINRVTGKVQRPPEISVVPCFNSTNFTLDFNCIFDIRIGHIIITGLKFAKLVLKYKLARRD